MEFVEETSNIEYIHINVKPKLYNPKKTKQQVYLLSIKKLIGYDVHYLLNQLKNAFGYEYFDKKILSNPEKLVSNIISISSIKLREHFYDFIKNNPLPPIKVIKDARYPITNQLNLSIDEKTHLKYIDGFYEPLDGYNELIALSLFFKCTHIPVIITI